MANGHKALAASKTKQWKICPGSIAVLEAMPELQRASGIHAQMGTCAHALVEKCLQEGSEPEAYRDRIIRIVEDEENGEYAEIMKANAKAPKDPAVVWFEVDDDMIDATTSMTDYVRERCTELGIDPKTLKLEQKVNPVPERDDTGGSADVWLDAWPDVLEIVDYKHGSGVFVPIEQNDQVRSYLLGAAIKTDFSHSLYRGTICQPRHHQGGVMFEEYTAEELKAFQEEIRAAAKQVDKARALMKKGATMQDLYEKGFISVGCDGSHCTFCELKVRTKKDGSLLTCPAIENQMQDMMAHDFADDPEAIELPESNEKLFSMVKWVPFLDRFAKEIKAEAEKRLVPLVQEREETYGYKFVEGKSNRRWGLTDEKKIVSTMQKKFGVAKELLYKPPSLLSGPQVEKLVDKKDRKQFNDEMLFKPHGKLVMVPESDKREAVIPPDAADDFEDDLEEDV